MPKNNKKPSKPLKLEIGVVDPIQDLLFSCIDNVVEQQSPSLHGGIPEGVYLPLVVGNMLQVAQENLQKVGLTVRYHTPDVIDRVVQLYGLALKIRRKGDQSTSMSDQSAYTDGCKQLTQSLGLTVFSMLEECSFCVPVSGPYSIDIHDMGVITVDDTMLAANHGGRGCADSLLCIEGRVIAFDYMTWVGTVSNAVADAFRGMRQCAPCDKVPSDGSQLWSESGLFGAGVQHGSHKENLGSNAVRSNGSHQELPDQAWASSGETAVDLIGTQFGKI